MILNPYGLDYSSGSYRIVHLTQEIFDEQTDLALIDFHGNKKVVLAIPDGHFFQNSFSDYQLKKLEEIFRTLTLHNIDLKAIDVESRAIARAITYFDTKAPACFGICQISPLASIAPAPEPKSYRLWLGIYANTQTVFIHEEKTGDIAKNGSLILHRALKLCRVKHPSLRIEKYYLLTPDSPASPWMLSAGLSLWDEKKHENLLSQIPASILQHPPKGEKKSMFKIMLKTVVAGLLTIGLLHGSLFLFSLFQQHRLNVLQHKAAHISHTVTLLENTKDQTALLKKHLSALTALKHKEDHPNHFLEQIGRVIPEGLFLTHFTLDNHAVTFSGRAQTQHQIDTFYTHLKELDTLSLHHIELSPVELDNTYPPYHYRFNLTAKREGETQ